LTHGKIDRVALTLSLVGVATSTLAASANFLSPKNKTATVVARHTGMTVDPHPTEIPLWIGSARAAWL